MRGRERVGTRATAELKRPCLSVPLCLCVSVSLCVSVCLVCLSTVCLLSVQWLSLCLCLSHLEVVGPGLSADGLPALLRHERLRVVVDLCTPTHAHTEGHTHQSVNAPGLFLSPSPCLPSLCLCLSVSVSLTPLPASRSVQMAGAEQPYKDTARRSARDAERAPPPLPLPSLFLFCLSPSLYPSPTPNPRAPSSSPIVLSARRNVSLARFAGLCGTTVIPSYKYRSSSLIEGGSKVGTDL